MKCHVALGKNGDILSILPLLHDEYSRTGEKQNLVVSKQYADVLNGTNYIVPHILDSHWTHLKTAIKWAKSKFDEVIVLQTYGKDFPIEQKTSSFQLDQYLRAGKLDSWDKLELVFDNRNKAREKKLRDKVAGRKKPYILLGDTSESSPFEHVAQLQSMLESEFGATHKIIKLSEIKADYFFDLLGLYDKAAALVTIETAHVHLSKASKVPTFVLANDRWRGSACSQKFRFFCRYAEWNRRKSKLISEIRECLDGVNPPVITEFKTQFPNGYNLSHLEWNGKMVATYRYHIKDWRTRMAFFDGEKHHELQGDKVLENYSLEDSRLFLFKDRLHAAYVVSTVIDEQFRCYMAYGEITEKDGIWSIGHIQPKYIGNDFGGLTKNWTPFVFDGKLHFLYGIRHEQQIVLELDGDKVVAEHKSPAPKWGNGEIRGGCITPHGSSLLRFFHSRSDYSDKSSRYFIGASLIENQPPFATKSVSTGSIMAGNEIYMPNCNRWKKNVIFPLGVIKRGDKFLLSMGINDCQSATVILNEKQLKL